MLIFLLCRYHCEMGVVNEDDTASPVASSRIVITGQRIGDILMGI